MAKVLINFIQDRSGSMSTVWDETLNGYKNFVNKMKEEDGNEYLFSLTTFDTLIETPIDAQPIDKVSVDELSKHSPRGSTALYDAVGKTIERTEKNSHGADKIIVVIVTDGQENSSREWKKDALHAAIDRLLNQGNWTFTYLGTQPETWDDAQTIGVGAGASSTYVGSNAGATYSVMANAVKKMSSSPVRGSRNLMSAFTDKSERSANMMKLREDDDDAGKVGKVNVHVSVTSPTPPKPTPPPSNKKWRQ